MDYTRNSSSRVKHWGQMTTEQRALSARIQARADRLRDRAAACGESLGIREAVDLAALQLGFGAPQDAS